MLEFLKSSTFRANEVVIKGFDILRKHYFSIAGLCLLLFVTNTLSTFLAVLMFGVEYKTVKVLFLFVFIVLFFGLQLVLIKRVVLLAKNIPHASLMTYLPSVRQFFNFILGLVIYSVLLLVSYLVCAILCLPLLYLGVDIHTISWEINPILTGVLMMLILIRIAFYPFFIVEKGFNIIRAFKMSIAFTKGNVIKLLILMLLLAAVYLLQITGEFFEYFFLAKILGLINTFVITPGVSVVLAVAYVEMMNEYEGSDNPRLFKSIL